MAGAGGYADKLRMPSMKKGGIVRKTGPVRLHKGEFVLTKAIVDKIRKAK